MIVIKSVTLCSLLASITLTGEPAHCFTDHIAPTCILTSSKCHTMRWHRLRVPTQNSIRLLIAFMLFGLFLIIPERSKPLSSTLRQKGTKGYVTKGGQWAVIPHLQKPKRWQALSSEWPLCMAVAAASSQITQQKLDAFLVVWPGWLSVSVWGPSIDAVHQVIQNISKGNQNIIDQVSFHAVYPLSTNTSLHAPHPLLMEVAATNCPSNWVALVGDVGLHPPPDDGPLSPLEDLLTQLNSEDAPGCIRATQFDVLHLQRLPSSVKELPWYKEFGALRKNEDAEVIIAKQGPPLQSALRGVCNGPLDKHIFFARVVDNASTKNENSCFME